MALTPEFIQENLVSKGFTSKYLLPSDREAYTKQNARFSDTCVKPAGIILLPNNPKEVAIGIQFSKLLTWVPKEERLAVRCGGHSFSAASSCTGGVVIDLTSMRKVTVEGDLARCQGGCMWRDVDQELVKHGRATVGGTVDDTGIGGLITGGGYGYLSGRYGLSIDCLVEVELVTSDGRVVRANEQENEDLIWGVRGGGGNFGVITEFVLKAFPQGALFGGITVLPFTAASEVCAFAKKYFSIDDPNAAFLISTGTMPGTFVKIIALIMVYDNPDPAVGEAFFKDVLSIAPLELPPQTAALFPPPQLIPYDKVNTLVNGIVPWGGRKTVKGTAISPNTLDEASFLEIVNKGEEICKKHTPEEILNTTPQLGFNFTVLFELLPFSKILELDNGKASFANRGRYYNVLCMTSWKLPALDEASRQVARDMAEVVKDVERRKGATAKEQDGNGVGLYGNYAMGDEKLAQVFGRNLERLKEVKKKWDPEMIFNKWNGIVV